MSMSDAVLDVVERIEAEAKEYKESDLHGTAKVFESFARELRLILKAAEATAVGDLRVRQDLTLYDPERLSGSATFTKEDRFQQEIKEKAAQEEVSGEQMVELVGGPLEGDYVPVPSYMPMGAKTNLAGSVYELGADRKLHYAGPFHAG